MASTRFAELDAVVAAALRTRYSAAVVRIEQGGRLQHERAFGRMRDDGPARPCVVDTRFDLASITKVFVAVAALMQVERGLLALDAPLTEFVPEWRGRAHREVTLRRILAHEPPAAAPGERVIYSDLGFIALGAIVARAAGRSLAAEVEAALRTGGVRSTGYRPRGPERASIPATETDAWRGSVQGDVHDEKAYLMAGIAGHAGLFGTARDVACLGEWHLAALHGRPTPLDPALAREAVREQAWDPVLRRGLGWALKTNDENSCGTLMSDDTFGHTGFTGTSIWADPARDLSVVLLTNNVHHGRTDLRDVRIAVADAVVRACDAAPVRA
jgi:CubicO group peptidase (beta-lactamase class C family)